MNNIYYALWLLCLFAMPAYAQIPSSTDSLIRIIESDTAVKVRIETCKQLVDAFIEAEDSASAVQYIYKGVAFAENEKSKYELRVKEAYLLFRREHYNRARVIYKEALKQSQREGWEVLVGDCLNVLGIIHYNQSEYDSAMVSLSEALEIRKKKGDKKRVGRSYINVGRVYFHQGDNLKALSLFEKGLQLSLEVGDNKNVIRCYNDIGIVHGTLRDLQMATAYFHKGLEIAEETQILDGLFQTYSNLGFLYSIKRDYRQSEYYYRKALIIGERQQDMLGVAVTMSACARLYSKQGNYQKSLSIYDSANIIFKDIGHKFHIGINYGTMGTIYKKIGNSAQAKLFFRKATQIGEEIEAKETMAHNYSHLGMLFLGQQQEDSAFYYVEKALKLFEETGNSHMLLNTLDGIGQIYAEQANLPKAISFYRRVLNSAESINDTLMIADTYSYIADLCLEQGDLDQAFFNYENAREDYERLKSYARVADMNSSVASTMNKQEKYADALQRMSIAVNTYQQFKDSCSLGRSYLTIAQSHIALTNTDSGSFYLKQALSYALQCQNMQSILLASVYGELGSFYQKQNKQDSSFVAYENALQYATLSQNRLIMKNAAETLYPIYEQKGMLAKALETFKIFHANNDSLFNEKNTRALVQQEYERELQGKTLLQQQREVELAKQKWVIYAMIGICFAFLGVALAIYRNYRNKYKANQLLTAKNQEISQQKTKLEALDRTKSRFFANISHELRTPLTLIGSPLQGLLHNPQEEFLPATKDTLSLMYRNTQSLKNLVNDILELSKLESDKIELYKEEVPIQPFLRRVASNFTSLAQHQGIIYEQSFESLPPDVIMLDAAKTEKVLNNFLSNAIKHSHAGGVVKIAATVEGMHLQIKVKDTGHGIAQADLPFIFDRFYQSVQPDAPLQGGTGIGLALAKELCQVMEGTINVESQLNEGSTFMVKLPYQIIQNPIAKHIIEDTSDELNDTIALIESLTIDKQYKILIVEDHPDMQAYINSLISPNHITLLASNGKDALKILESEPVNLIISDVMMPEMDGYTLLQHLKDSDTYGGIPVIMLTALGDEAHKLQALTIGVDDYLTKPFSPEELLVRVQNILVRYEARLRWKEEEAKEVALEVNYFTEGGRREGDFETSSHQIDTEWLKKVEKIIFSNLENEDFRLVDLAEQFNLSYRQFLRRIQKTTGLTLKQYQQEIALQKAREFLEKGTYGNASAVAYSIGMSHVTRFSKLYEERFGKKPSEYFANFNAII
ncbi:MAG: signal transduction histidine kinase/response regulator of citrate/malate metabolism [Flammeovirgaceae bacterium]|jgi:signal transduction histidine kinase/response regulator of citrate/malate metabolism/uncharacterized protein HemY